MKDLETLRKLAKNPFYKLSSQELQALEDLEKQQRVALTKDKRKATAKTTEVETETVADGPKERSPRKVSSKGNAAVKETGKLNKHSSDPVSE